MALDDRILYSAQSNNSLSTDLTSLRVDDEVKNFKLRNRSRHFKNDVSAAHPTDSYTIRFTKSRTLHLRLSDLGADLDVLILNEAGQVLQRSAQSGTESEALDLHLDAGTYKIRVYGQNDVSSSYDLRLWSRRNRHTPTIAMDSEQGVNGLVSGTIHSQRGLSWVRAGLDDAPYSAYQPLTLDLDRGGRFSLSLEQLKQVFGAALSDGSHRLRLQVLNQRGVVSQVVERVIVLDQTPPRSPQLQLLQAFDSGVIGDRKTTFQAVTLIGQTEANAQVRLSELGLNTVADATGQFRFENVGLQLGRNVLTAIARDAAGNENRTETEIQREVEDRNQILGDWNATLLRAVQAARSAPPIAARAMAMMNGAMYDAVNSITRIGKAYRTTVSAPAEASAEAAAAQAAYEVLLSLFPTQKATFDTTRSESLAKLMAGQAVQGGIAVGTQVASQMLNWRGSDGSTTVVNYTPLSGDQYWRPTPPSNSAALLPQWKDLTPFVMTSSSQFRPSGPPAFDSAQYRSELEQVRRLGRATNSDRTADQTEIAKFWADGSGTWTPPGHWIEIAQQLAIARHNTFSENAQLFEMLSVAVADAAIVAWDAKYTFNQCRPVSALQATDPTWMPLLVTPPFPDYVSGHSTFSGAASAVLANFYGSDRMSFSTTSLGLPGVTRSFTSFSQAADEAGVSRIYGGIHGQSSNADGLAAGRALGNYVYQTLVG